MTDELAKTDQNTWWQLRCSIEMLDEATIDVMSYELVSTHQMAGAVRENEKELIAYLQCSQAEIKKKRVEIESNYGTPAQYEIVEIKNWVAESESSWTSITEGAITVEPCVTPHAAHPPAKDVIRIHPGTGFGTGHHATTRMLLGALQSPVLQSRNPKKILDIGTGSGLLAIAASQFFNTPVDAFDIDPMAIDNARINLELNFVNSVRLSVATIAEFPATYDLVIANLYAELLVELCVAIVEGTAPGGTILLSGILADLWPAVENAFTSNSCQLEMSLLSSDCWAVKEHEKVWCAAQFVRSAG